MINIGLKYIYFFILPTFFVVFGLRLIIGKRTLPQRILGIYFLAFFLRNISAYQLAEASSPYFIHFHFVQSPLHYLFGPLGFLFCFYALRPYRKFKWYDLFHFLPFFIHLVELIPFFFGPTENKFKDLELSLNAGSYIFYPSIAGKIPVVYHAVFKILYSNVYLILEIIMWFRYAKKQDSIFYKNNNLLIKWIGLDLVFKVISIILIVLQFIGVFNVHTVATFSPGDLIMFLGGIMNFVFFLFSPKLLNGALFESLSPNYFGNNHTEQMGGKVAIKEGDSGINKSLRKLQIFMEVEAPFLQEDFSIKVLASQLKISERNLSKLIREHFDMSFPDFVGSYRLNYLKKILQEQGSSTGFTIEKLAEKSGFGSRQALYKVVQRLHQTTPNKYFDVK